MSKVRGGEGRIAGWGEEVPRAISPPRDSVYPHRSVDLEHCALGNSAPKETRTFAARGESTPEG